MRGFGGLAVRIWLCAALGQVFALLAFFNGLEEVRSVETRRQLETLLTRATVSVSAKAALGFPLEYQPDLQRLVAALTVDAGRSERIYILNTEGVVVFASDQGAVGSTAPAAWLAGRGGEGTWTAKSRGEVLVGTDVLNAISVPIGTVIARSPREGMIIDVFATLQTSVVVACLFLGLGALVAWLGTLLATRPLAARLEGMAHAFQEATSDLRAGIPPEPEGERGTVAAAVRVVAAMEAVEAAGRSVDRAVRAKRGPAAPDGPLPDGPRPGGAAESRSRSIEEVSA